MLVPTFEVYFFMGKTRKKQRQYSVEVKLGDIVNKTHVVLIIGQNKMYAKIRTLPEQKLEEYVCYLNNERVCLT